MINRYPFQLNLLCGLLWASLSCHVWGGTNPNFTGVELESVVSKAAAAKSQRVAIDYERGRSLKSAVFQSIDQLQQHLGTINDKRSVDRFGRYCEQLLQSLSETEVSFERVNEQAKRLYGSNLYFSTPPFLELRNHLVSYIFWLRTTTEKDPHVYQDQYEMHLQRIMDELQQNNANPDLAEIAPSVNWLVHSGHAKDFVSELKNQFQFAGVLIDANPEHEIFPVSDFQKEIDQTQFASNLIVGTRVSGDYRMTGNLKVELLDRKDRATIRLYLDNGKIRSDNSVGVRSLPGLNGQVVLNGTARTLIEYAYVDVYFAKNQLHFEKPQVKCRAESDMSSVKFQRNYLLPNKRARREWLGLGPDILESVLSVPVAFAAQNKKAEADQEASRVADQNLIKSLEEQIAKELTKVSRELQNEIENVIEPNTVRQGIYFDEIHSATSPGRVRIAFDKKGVAHMGAPESRRAYNDSMDAVLEINIHESSFLNFFTEFSSGATWNDTTWAYLQKTLSGLNSYCFLIGTRERWSCKMDWDAPVSLRLDDGLITFSFRIQAMTISGQTYNNPFKVSASYRPKAEHYGVDLIRDGKVKIEFQADNPDQKLESFVRETFEDLLVAKQHWDSMIIPYGGTFGEMEDMRIEKFTIEDGWFVAEVSPGQSDAKASNGSAGNGQSGKEVTIPSMSFSSLPR